MQISNDPTCQMQMLHSTSMADAAKGVGDFYSLKQTQTVIKRPRFYSQALLCQFVMKIMIVFNPVGMCIRTAGVAGRGCVCLMKLFDTSHVFCLSSITLFQISLELFVR